MQELIEYLNSVEQDFKQKNWRSLAAVVSMIIDKVKELLEKEKEQMCDFADWYASGLTNAERWHKSIEEHYKDFLLFSRPRKRANKL